MVMPEPPAPSRRRLLSKRCLDLALAGPLLLVVTPLLACIALLIQARSPGPVLFRQVRIGQGDTAFNIYKLRTMHAGVPDDDRQSVTLRDDPRIVPGVRWVRKYKLDELPQILNIIDGSMSLVGPRPTVPLDVARMDERQRRRHLVPPGLTGLAQLNGGTTISWPRRIEHDLRYVATLSLRQDLLLLFRTVRHVVGGHADTHPTGEDEWTEPEASTPPAGPTKRSGSVSVQARDQPGPAGHNGFGREQPLRTVE
jgi:lipopolysaccharide/colanic/teichoic acid biosynthesis glycosyltransferase